MQAKGVIISEFTEVSGIYDGEQTKSEVNAFCNKFNAILSDLENEINTRTKDGGGLGETDFKVAGKALLTESIARINESIAELRDSSTKLSENFELEVLDERTKQLEELIKLLTKRCEEVKATINSLNSKKALSTSDYEKDMYDKQISYYRNVEERYKTRLQGANQAFYSL